MIIKRVRTRELILCLFWSRDNLVNFRNIQKHFWISKDNVSNHPSVIVQLLMSYQRSLGILKILLISKDVVTIHP